MTVASITCERRGGVLIHRSQKELVSGGADVTPQLQALETGQGHTLPWSLTANIALLGHLFPILIEFFAGIELTKEVSEIVDWAVTLA